MNREECRILEYIMLSLIKGLGPVSQNRILQLCGGDIARCFRLEGEELLEINRKYSINTHAAALQEGKLRAFIEWRCRPELQCSASRIFENCRKCGIDVIIKDDGAYPRRFHGIEDAPILLYTKGTLSINEYPVSIGVVGARRCTPDARQNAIMTAESEAGKGSAVISGMAKGIDSYAHTAALKTGGYTIAVLGNGPDICYPAEHEKLYEAIQEKGCILSEYPPGAAPRTFMFPRRNRLIAALSDKVYIIGAGRNSGTETTVEYCRKYGRETGRYEPETGGRSHR